MFEERLVPVNYILNDFEKRLAGDCLKKLDADDDLRFNSFATPFRELIRRFLERVAPDAEVRNCEWFRPENKKNPDDISRRQRAFYAIKGGLRDEFIADELGLDISREPKN